jgi:hypothetical protein
MIHDCLDASRGFLTRALDAGMGCGSLCGALPWKRKRVMRRRDDRREEYEPADEQRDSDPQRESIGVRDTADYATTHFVHAVHTGIARTSAYWSEFHPAHSLAHIPEFQMRTG